MCITAICVESSPASSTAIAWTGRGTPRTASASTRPSCCSIRRRWRFAATIDWSKPIYPYQAGGADPDLARDDRDNADGMPKSVVVNPYFDWEQDRSPNTPLSDSIIYELHVKGFSKLNPEVPEELRGTYAGLASPASIRYLKRLGVTAVELLPVHQLVNDKQLIDRNLSATTGATTRSPTSVRSRATPPAATPAARWRSSRPWSRRCIAKTSRSFSMWCTTTPARATSLAPCSACAASTIPPTTALSRICPRYYTDYTGTGNTLNVRHPQVLKLIMDSLRYWATEMHVDGFRFDLASALARELHDVDRLSSFFDIIHQDPILSRLKLIAEPWDVGDGGYQVGNFPVLWAEWNGKYRDTVRRYWKGDEGQLSDLAYRLTGSSDLYQARWTQAVCFHQLRHRARRLYPARPGELQRQKHNQANGEDNQDGANDNNSWNMGAEGPTARSGDRARATGADAKLSGHAAALPGRAHALRRRRSCAHPAGQQQCLLPGQRVELVRLEAQPRSRSACWSLPPA